MPVGDTRGGGDRRGCPRGRAALTLLLTKREKIWNVSLDIFESKPVSASLFRVQLQPMELAATRPHCRRNPCRARLLCGAKRLGINRTSAFPGK